MSESSEIFDDRDISPTIRRKLLIHAKSELPGPRPDAAQRLALGVILQAMRDCRPACKERENAYSWLCGERNEESLGVFCDAAKLNREIVKDWAKLSGPDEIYRISLTIKTNRSRKAR